MKRAIRTHARDFAAIVILLLLAAGTAGYILLHQPAFTLFRSYYVVHAEFATSSAVSPGQGEAVTIAGVPVGTVGAVQLENGKALVTMDIDKKDAPIYANATVLLRERTPLKDMYLSLYPGTAGAARVPNGGTLAVGQTQPDVDVDQILSSLDSDTRTYLELALSGGSEALSGKTSSALREVFKRFPPLVHSTAQFTGLLAERSADLKASIHNLDQVAGALGGVDSDLSDLISTSNTDFTAISSQDTALESALSEAPSVLSTTDSALSKVATFAATAAPALAELKPFAKQLAPALKAVRPLAQDTNSEIKDVLIPFSTAVQPLAKALAPAAKSLATVVPEVTTTLGFVNQLLNAAAYEPSGKDNDSYLFWGSWLAHNADSILSYQDANGAVVRGLFMATCPALNVLQNVLQESQPAIGALLDLLNAPDSSTLSSSYCPATLSTTSTSTTATSTATTAAATTATTASTATAAEALETAIKALATAAKPTATTASTSTAAAAALSSAASTASTASTATTASAATTTSTTTATSPTN